MTEVQSTLYTEPYSLSGGWDKKHNTVEPSEERRIEKEADVARRSVPSL